MDIVIGDDPGGAHEDAVVEADQGDDGNDASSQEGMDNLRKINLQFKIQRHIILVPGKRCQIGCIPLC